MAQADHWRPGPFPCSKPFSCTQSTDGFLCPPGSPTKYFRRSITSCPTKATPVVIASGHHSDNLLFFFHVPWTLPRRGRWLALLSVGSKPGAEVSGHTAGLAGSPLRDLALGAAGIQAAPQCPFRAPAQAWSSDHPGSPWDLSLLLPPGTRWAL